MKSAHYTIRPTRARSVWAMMSVILLAPLLSACAATIDASTSTRFDPDSDKATVLVGTSVNASQTFSWSGRSLATYWHEYNFATGRLVPKGQTFLTKIRELPFGESDYESPSVRVMEVEPGDYALIGAGFPHQMTIYVNTIDGRNQIETRSPVVDPREHIDPRAAVDPDRNFLFSVDAGQIVYIGHFQFLKLKDLDRLVAIHYSQDLPAARAALKEYPGVTGEIIPLNLTVRTETAAR